MNILRVVLPHDSKVTVEVSYSEFVEKSAYVFFDSLELLNPFQSLEKSEPPEEIHTINSCLRKIEKLTNDNEKLKKCAEFYANTSNWQDLNDRTEPNNETNIIGDSEETGIDAFFDACFVGGKLARQTLKEVE